MKKLNYLTLLLALLVSSSMWGGEIRPSITFFENVEKENLLGSPDMNLVQKVLAEKFPGSQVRLNSNNPSRKAVNSVVAYIGEVGYPSWDSAYAVAADGDTIRLNTNLLHPLVIKKNIVLDLNSHYVYSKTSQYIIYNQANVTILNGQILTYGSTYYEEGGTEVSGSKTFAIYTKSGTLTLDNVTISGDEGGYPYNALYIYGGSVVVSNSTLYGANAAIFTVGELSISGSTAVYGSRGITVYNSGNVTISDDSYIYGYYYGIYSNATGEINIVGRSRIDCDLYYAIVLYAATHLNMSENARINAYGSTYGYALVTDNSGAVVNISGNAYFYNKERVALFLLNSGTINIYSGTFESTLGRCINSSATLNVYGGTFITPKYKSDGQTEMNAIESVGTTKIYGGIFINKLVPLPSGYDYKTIGENKFEVCKIYAQIAGSEKSYFTIADAISEANENDEIILLADTTDSFVTGKSLTFNTNGKTLNGNVVATGDAVVSIIEMGTINGTLSVQDNGKIKAYEGFYANNPSAFVPFDESCTCTQEGTLWKVTQKAAKIGEVEYKTFADAVAAAEEMSDPVIELLANAKLRSDIHQNITKSMTIDLKGYTLTSSSSELSFLRLGTVGTVLTIKNGRISNSVTATKYPNALITQVAANTLILEDVEIVNKGKTSILLMANGGACEIDADCSASGSESGVRLAANAELTNSAEIIVSVQGSDATIVNNENAVISLKTYETYDGNLTITNHGNFEVIDGVYDNTFSVQSGSNDMVVKGGVFYPTTKKAVESFKASDKAWNEIKYQGDSAYNLYAIGQLPVAILDEQNYYSLSDAINAVAADSVEKTIVLQQDIDVEIVSNAAYVIAAGQNIVLDLNGKKIDAINNTVVNVLAVVFNVVKDSKLTINDNSLAKTGVITYKNTCPGGWTVYTINCEGTLIVNGGTIENTSSLGATPYAIELGKAGKMTVNDGLIYSKSSLAIRYWADESTATVLNLNGGEIKGKVRALWIQLPDNDPSSSPYAEFNMTGGKLTCEKEGAEAFYVYTYGESLNNITINVSDGIIDGRFIIGGGVRNGGNYNENISISGGTFITSNAFESIKRGVEQHAISGGAYFFDTNDSSYTNSDYIKLCEYVKTGHYVMKMCRDDENGTFSKVGIDGKYKPCVGDDCGDGTFWAVIDGEGVEPEQKPTKPGEWSGTSSGIFAPDSVPSIKTDVTISTSVNVMSGVLAQANRLILDEGAGIRVKYDATLEVGLGGIEVNGDGTGTTYIIVEPGGTLKANGTVVSSSVKEIIVEANKDFTGTVLFDPALDYNNQPKSTVQMYTYARYIPSQEKYIWQHFGIPTKEAPLSITNNRSCLTQYWQWNYEQADWEQVNYATDKAVNTPFRGYNIKTNYQGDNGVTYTFTGNILGNGDATFDLKPGFNFYANSYLAPINATTLISDMEDDNNIEWTVWMYDGKVDNFDIMNETSLYFGENVDIPAMRGFFLRLTDGLGGTSGINYENAVWGNAINKQHAPARKLNKENLNMVKLSVEASDGQSDKMYFLEGDQFDAGFNNGFDATKLMSKPGINLFAETMNGDLSMVATDNLDGQYLSLETKDQTNYTITFSHQNGDVYTLVDLENNRTTQMVDGATYTFTAPANTTLSRRFQIRKVTNVVTGVEDVKNNLKDNGVFTVLGQFAGNVNDWSLLPSGVYVINGEKVVK